jgi:SAM-dependent methyltransferase
VRTGHRRRRRPVRAPDWLLGRAAGFVMARRTAGGTRAVSPARHPAQRSRARDRVWAGSRDSGAQPHRIGTRDRALRADAAPGEAANRGRPPARGGRAGARSVDELSAFEAQFDSLSAVNAMLFWRQPAASLEQLRRLLRTDGVIAAAINRVPRGDERRDIGGQGSGDRSGPRRGRVLEVRLETLRRKPPVCARWCERRRR